MEAVSLPDSTERVIFYRRFGADLAEIQVCSRDLTEALRPFADQAFAIELCVEELLMNSLSNGFQQRNDGKIELTVTLAGSDIIIDLADNGVAFNPFTEVAAPDLDSPLAQRQVGGLGIYLVKHMADCCDYRYEQGMNRIQLVKKGRHFPPEKCDQG